MEQVRHRVNKRLFCDEHKLTKAVSKVSFRQSEIINDDLVLVRGAKQTITLNKPISAGFTILEISKLIMYRFFYDYLKPKYGDKCKLLFTDTDSLCCREGVINCRVGQLGSRAARRVASRYGTCYKLPRRGTRRVG